MGALWSYVQLFWTSDDGKVDPITGLTERQKKAVQSSWQSIRADPKGSGVILFTQFFAANPEAIDFFRTMRGKKLEELKGSPHLRAHGTTVVSTLTAYVDNLDDTECLGDLLSKTGRDHHPRGAKRVHFQAFTESLIGFLESQLGSKFDEFTKEAWIQAMKSFNAGIYSGLSEVEGKQKENEA